MKGVPVRVEIGPKDIEKNQCVVVRRDTREKAFVSIDELVPFVENLMVTIHNDMYDRALKNTQEKTFTATTFDEFVDTAKNKPGFIKAMWCGDTACEEKIKEVTGGVKADVSRSTRSISRMFAYAAASLQSIWYSGASSINL